MLHEQDIMSAVNNSCHTETSSILSPLLTQLIVHLSWLHLIVHRYETDQKLVIYMYLHKNIDVLIYSLVSTFVV